MKDKVQLIKKHLKDGTLQKMWIQTRWIYQYARRYWKAMVLYTVLGLAGTGVSLVSSMISKDLVDIITGHQTGKLLSTFAAMIGFSVANILVGQASGYASTFINLKVDAEIKKRHICQDAGHRLGITHGIPHGRSGHQVEFRCIEYLERYPELDPELDHLYDKVRECVVGCDLL